ncbi:nicotinamide N-methyltransferase-like [Ranitomeya imitator]|uniref:nicotinamide N-methyltransferase-like n=1 Tax=Ranitomeya imitator TaxID=111125 RepID=UPI0037E89179
MVSSPTKFYLEDDFDPKQFQEQYLSDKTNLSADFLDFPMTNLTKTFSEGKIKGHTLLDISVGTMVCQLLPACDHFENIIVLKSRDKYITELKRWANSPTGLLDWGHLAKPYVDTEGKSENFQKKEEKVRSAAQHVMKIDLEKENIVEPMVLPQADAIISYRIPDVVSQEEKDYRKLVRKFQNYLKPGGIIIIVGDLDNTHYTVGKDKFHALNYNEDFVKKALVGGGFVVDHSEVKKRTAVSDLTDYKAVMFTVAHKPM